MVKDAAADEKCDLDNFYFLYLINLIYYFFLDLSKLTHSGLVAEVKKLFDSAYQLGCEESKEMTRGKYLKVLLKKPNPSS